MSSDMVGGQDVVDDIALLSNNDMQNLVKTKYWCLYYHLTPLGGPRFITKVGLYKRS